MYPRIKCLPLSYNICTYSRIYFFIMFHTFCIHPDVHINENLYIIYLNIYHVYLLAFILEKKFCAFIVNFKIIYIGILIQTRK